MSRILTVIQQAENALSGKTDYEKLAKVAKTMAILSTQDGYNYMLPPLMIVAKQLAQSSDPDHALQAFGALGVINYTSKMPPDTHQLFVKKLMSTRINGTKWSDYVDAKFEDPRVRPFKAASRLAYPQNTALDPKTRDAIIAGISKLSPEDQKEVIAKTRTLTQSRIKLLKARRPSKAEADAFVAKHAPFVD